MAIRTKELKAVDQQIGARLRARRIMLGMSQTVLGEAIGLTFQQIQKYERGANRIGGSRMQQLASALKCSPSYFFGGDGKDASVIDVASTLLTRHDSRRLLEAFSRIEDGPMRAAIVNLVEAAAVKGIARRDGRA